MHVSVIIGSGSMLYVLDLRISVQEMVRLGLERGLFVTYTSRDLSRALMELCKTPQVLVMLFEEYER